MGDIPKSRKPLIEAQTHLRNTLSKRPQNAPEGMRKLLPHLLLFWWTNRQRGFDFIYPGKTMIADWARVTKRTAQRYTKVLEERGILVCVGHRHGGRGMAKEYQINIKAVKPWLVENGYNPSPELISKLERAELVSKKGDKKRGSVSPRIDMDMGTPRKRTTLPFGNLAPSASDKGSEDPGPFASQ